MAHELKRRGFRFVGPTICYSLMQAAGLVDDHTADCFRYGVRLVGGLRVALVVAEAAGERVALQVLVVLASLEVLRG